MNNDIIRCDSCGEATPDWQICVTEDKEHAFCSYECAERFGYELNEYDELVRR